MDTATTEISTLSLHDALPIYLRGSGPAADSAVAAMAGANPLYIPRNVQDRKSTRLNSSHVAISYAVFCLKKKKMNTACGIPYRPPPQIIEIAANSIAHQMGI